MTTHVSFLSPFQMYFVFVLHSACESDDTFVNIWPYKYLGCLYQTFFLKTLGHLLQTWSDKLTATVF